jgi:hypothetical protein
MTAPLHVTSGPLTADELMGRAALALGERPKYKFAVHEGDRRRFGDRTPRPAVDLKIIREDQPCR